MSSYTESELQCIIDEFFDKIKTKLSAEFSPSEYVPSRDNRKNKLVKIANAKISLKYANWFFEKRGKNLKKLVNQEYKNKINDLSKEGLESIKRLFGEGFIPIEIVEIFQELQTKAE